jgi:hypothetical protein
VLQNSTLCLRVTPVRAHCPCKTEIGSQKIQAAMRPFKSNSSVEVANSQPSSKPKSHVSTAARGKRTFVFQALPGFPYVKLEATQSLK